MRALLSLFGRSPFSPLQKHMEKVAECVEALEELFIMLPNADASQLEAMAKRISKLEHNADLAKNDIRDHLPKSLFLPVDRSHLLEVLSLQDSLADTAEDVAILVSMKPPEMLPEILELFIPFLAKNFETFQGARKIIQELDELLETSFGGIEADRVRKMVEEVAFKEHESDLLQRELARALFCMENRLSVTSFYQWMKIVETLSSLSNLSENLGNKIRAMLELKG